MRRLVVTAALLGLVSIAAAFGASARSATPPAATPTVGADYRTLLEVTLPADVLPHGPAVVGLLRFTLAPGASVTSPAGSAPPSVAFEIIGAGSYAVRSEGRLLVVRRATGKPAAGEPVAPGTEVTLGPGDAVVYLDNQASQRVRNAGRDTVVGL